MSELKGPRPGESGDPGEGPHRPAGADRAREAVPSGRLPSPAEPDDDQGGDWELFLLRLRYRVGRLVAAAGHEPILLDDPETIWVVYSGHVEVFAVRVDGGQAVGPRQHLFSADAGDALCGMAWGSGPIGLLASGVPGTEFLRLKRSALAQLVEARAFVPLVAALVERWVEGLSGSLAGELPPREFVMLQAGDDRELGTDGVVRTRGGVLWVRHEAGTSRYLGRAELPMLGSGDTVPLAPIAWLQAVDAARLTTADTRTVLQAGTGWVSLDIFHALFLAAFAADAERHQRAEQEHLAERARLAQARLGGAYRRLTSVLASNQDTWAEVDAREPLLAACQLVGNFLGIPVKVPPTALQAAVRNTAILEIARASRVRTRSVALRGAWWNGEHGPLLGYLAQERRAVALLPAANGSYELHDPTQRTRQRVTAAVAASLRPFAYAFYRRFDSGPLTAWDVVRFGFHGSTRDLRRVLLLGVATGLLAMLIPIATGALFDLVIPSAQRPLLLQIGAGLVVAALAAALFELTRAFSVLRLTTALGATETAVMDRLLELPLPFYRDYTAGDLSQRALGLQTLRETLTGGAISTLLSCLFTVFSLLLLFVYDSRLALVACGLVLVLAVALIGVGYLHVRYQLTLGQLAGRVAGATLQLINGVAKLRIAGAEERAFAFWAERFSEQRRIAYRARKVDDAMAVFEAAYPVLALLVLFGVVGLALQPTPSTGAFLAFNAAFGQIVAAQLALSNVFPTLLRVVPAYERARPILQAPLEAKAGQVEPGELSGALAIDRVSFRYSADGPLILDDVSLRLRPGEFVALVGPSGSGKSTLVRLLLGFEAPASGAILYDGRDLATLDVRAVRRQIGTVLQTGRLMTGDIYTNIVGASMLTLDDAWEAVRRAQLAEDIEAMPMGMHTAIGEGGSTLSGGQRQRLLIARAVVNRPRIIFFDEATSALDNRTQQLVSRSLETLAATRVVIAHRLSTVVNADRIYVLKNGRIVESGAYRELMQRRGVFADLARRQIA